MGWDGWMESYPSDCLDYLSICGEAYSRHESSVLSCLILTKERCHQWLPSKTIGTKEKKSLPAHSSQDTAASISCPPSTWYYIAMMHLFLCVCRQLFAKIQTASNISCFVSHIQTRPGYFCAKDCLGLVRIWSLGRSQQLFFCVFSHFRHGHEQTNERQPGDPSASLLLTSEKAVFCKMWCQWQIGFPWCYLQMSTSTSTIVFSSVRVT